MNSGQATSVIIFIAFWVIFLSVMFWFYGLTPIVHWFIKSNGDTARAVVLEVRKAGWGWYVGGAYTEQLIFQPVKVKLEVHPTNGAPYIAYDRFNAKADIYRGALKPGAEMQVSIARFSPQWVASWPETATGGAQQQQRLGELYARASDAAGQPAGGAAAPAPSRSNTGVIVGVAVGVMLLCGCLAVAGGLAYTRFFAGRGLSGLSSPLPTAAAMSIAASTPLPTAGPNTATIPTGGLADASTRATAWGQAITAILQADPTSCTSPDGAKTTIVVTHKPRNSGPWYERWTVACDGAASIPVDILFTPVSGGVVTVKAVVGK